MQSRSDNKPIRSKRTPPPLKSLHTKRPRRRTARGLVVIWAVVFLILSLVFVSMGIEYAWLVDHQTRAQTAAEAASLAGAQKLGIGKAEALTDATSTALLNPGTQESVILLSTEDNSGGDIQFGRWVEETQTFLPDLLASNALQITVKFRDGHPNGSVRLLYGDLLGGYSNVSASAVAHRRPVMPVPDRMWVLDSASNALVIQNGGLVETTGACTVESDQSGAIRVDSGGTLKGTLIDVAGTVEFDSYKSVLGLLRQQSPSGPNSGIEPAPTYPEPPVDSLAEQTYADWSSVKLKPGYYPNGLTANTGNFRLRNGLYRFGGPGIVLRGTADLNSSNALIYLDEGSDLVLDGATMNLGGPVSNGPNTSDLSDWIGIALIGHSKGAGQYIAIKTTASLSSSDGIYLPTATIEVSGGNAQIGTLVCKKLQVENDGGLVIGDQAPHPHQHLLVK